MMTRTHGVTGLAVWMTGDAITRGLDLHHPPYVTIAGALIAWGAAKAPDIDNPDSRPGRKLNGVIPGLSDAINAALGHRGLTHWAGTGIVVGTIVGVLACLIHPSLWWTGLAVTVGWITHIAGDCCTYRGAPAYGPIRCDPIRLPYGYRIECGGQIEDRIVYPVAWIWTLYASMASIALASA
jgi:membrane-bound metal-dependent hydrolase YbcI (DUF457 family)